MADEMENEFMKRGFLLPKGCKDLSDVSKSKSKSESAASVMPQRSEPTPLPPITGEMTVPLRMSVIELAAALAQKPFRIIGDLMEFGVFATLKQELDFDTISKVARKYGYVAKRVA